MTKKELKWRLRELPSGGEVAQLVEQEVITKEEAKDLLFNESKSNDDVEQLKKQIDFLEGLVKELSKNRTQTVYVDRYIDRWVQRLPIVWCNAVNTATGSTATGSTTVALPSTYSTTLTNYSAQLLK